MSKFPVKRIGKVGQHISDGQWRFYDENGYVKLGRIVNDDQLKALQQRIDDVMLGKAKLDYDRTLMQVDSTDGTYGSTGPQSTGHKGSHLNYRKIEQLEFDPLFLRYMQRPVFREACAHVYGADTPITVMRAMFMNKPAGKGTWLPWHQDIWGNYDRNPRITVWLALDPATRDNGGIQIIPGSHKRGHINPDHNAGFLTEQLAKEHCPPQDAQHLELEAGEVVLLHNYLLHASDVNRSQHPRRAFSVCYMDAATTDSRGGEYMLVFGQGASSPEKLESTTV